MKGAENKGNITRYNNAKAILPRYGNDYINQNKAILIPKSQDMRLSVAMCKYHLFLNKVIWSKRLISQSLHRLAHSFHPTEVILGLSQLLV